MGAERESGTAPRRRSRNARSGDAAGAAVTVLQWGRGRDDANRARPSADLGRARGIGTRLAGRRRLMTRRWGARELLDLVLDPDSFDSWDTPVDRSGVSDDYLAELRAAEERSGCDESVLTGRGLVRGRPVAVVVNEFRFLAGSIGKAAATRIIAAVQRATAERLPLLATTASGGTRMQEGTPAFFQMVEISRALMAFRAAGLPYLVYLRHPTTGGVFASWGSLAHVTVAEPDALIAFLGPKVYEGLHGQPFPPGVQTAENLAAHGIVDAVVPPEALPGLRSEEHTSELQS